MTRILLAILLSAFFVPLAAAQIVKPPPKIDIISTQARILTTSHDQSRFYLLWNKLKRGRPIGHAIYTCHRGYGDARICTAVFTMPLGRIVATGEIHGFEHYTLIVTSGSRCYQNADPGVVGTWKVGTNTNRLLFVLNRTCTQ